MCILSSYDINVCRCSYDVFTRRISYPCDKHDYMYAQARKFFYTVHRNCRDTLKRIAKYQSRGFEFLGYYQVCRNDSFIHLASSNAIIPCKKDEIIDYFLTDVTVPNGKSEEDSSN
jgi:hypothetical protein